MLPDTKKCSTCQEVKPLDSFGRNAKGKNGREAQCKECRRVYSSRYREKNKDRITEGQRIYREKNKDRIAERQRLYHEKNKEYINKKVKYNRDSKQESSKAMASKSGAYSPSEDQFIILNHKTMTEYQMAITLGRTCGSTQRRKGILRKKGLL